ncbi:HEPN domain-containing protein [bacterium]|nr:HEPN domain-containing protein [bacterium]
MNREEAISILIRRRITQAESTLQDARCLLSGNGSPQSIINRSYYAMFYSILALMLKIGKSFSRHSGAISAFDREFIRTGMLPDSLSADLHWIFELRQEHDYKIISDPAMEDANLAADKAERFVAAVKGYLRC